QEVDQEDPETRLTAEKFAATKAKNDGEVFYNTRGHGQGIAAIYPNSPRKGRYDLQEAKQRPDDGHAASRCRAAESHASEEHWNEKHEIAQHDCSAEHKRNQDGNPEDS